MKKKVNFSVSLFIIVLFSLFAFFFCILNQRYSVYLIRYILPTYHVKNDGDVVFHGRYDDLEILGKEQIKIIEEEDKTIKERFIEKENIRLEDVAKMNKKTFINKFYTIDQKTNLRENDIDLDVFSKKNFQFTQKAKGPKILIYHTHSCETYQDSIDFTEGVVMVGAELKKILENKYGVSVLHHTDRYDYINQTRAVKGSYERSEIGVREVLRKNPSIEVSIDIHRDAIGDESSLVYRHQGKKSAQIMFVNGLSQINEKGNLTEISYLYNPYKKDNLAFSYRMQLIANERYPGLTRKIYLNAYRYNLHILPYSCLLEVGTEKNSKEEAIYAIHLFAEILAEVLHLNIHK